MTTVLIFDCDVLAYRAASVVEKREVKVIHKASGREKIFGTRTQFKEYLDEMDFEFKKDDYEFVDIQTPQDVSVAFSILKNQIKAIEEATWADNSIFLIGGSTNFRDNLPLPTKYKSNRESMIRPVLLKQVKQYLINHYNAQVIEGCETDDALIWSAYRVMDFDDTPILVTNDKDSNAYSGVCIYNYTEENPQIVTIPQLGSVWYSVEKKKVVGNGFLWYAFQLITGDVTDNFKPSELANVKFGDKSALKALQDCKSEKEAIEVCINLYKKWYPEPFEYTAWNGEVIKADWKFLMDLYHKCCRMKSSPNDPLIIKDFLKKYDVDLDNY